jgi:hypothetical protein
MIRRKFPHSAHALAGHIWPDQHTMCLTCMQTHNDNKMHLCFNNSARLTWDRNPSGESPEQHTRGCSGNVCTTAMNRCSVIMHQECHTAHTIAVTAGSLEPAMPSTVVLALYASVTHKCISMHISMHQLLCTVLAWARHSDANVHDRARS